MVFFNMLQKGNMERRPKYDLDYVMRMLTCILLEGLKSLVVYEEETRGTAARQRLHLNSGESEAY